MRRRAIGGNAVAIRPSSELPTRSFSTVVSVHCSHLHYLVWLERHVITRFRLLRRWLSRGRILDQLAVISQWRSTVRARVAEFKHNLFCMGNNYPRVRVGQCTDRADVWLCRQPPSFFDYETRRHRDLS